MVDESYPALFHFIHRQLRDISYPVTRQALLETAGERAVQTDWAASVPLRELMRGMRKEQFSCAAEFYCDLIAAMTRSGEQAGARPCADK